MTDERDRYAVLALSAFVRQVCTEKGITQRELARRTGLRRELVGRIHRGQASPSITVVFTLARGMGVSLRELGEALDPPRKHRPNGRTMAEVDPAALVRLGRAIRVRRHVLRLSQKEAAVRVGMHRNYIGALERGEINATYGTLLRVSTGLRMAVEELIAEAQKAEED